MVAEDPQPTLQNQRARWSKHWAKLVFGAILAGIVALFWSIPALDWHMETRRREAMAAGTLYKISRLETQYANTHPAKGYACDLSVLPPPDEAPGDYEYPFVTGVQGGYYFRLSGCSGDANDAIRHYQAIAIPMVIESTGSDAFCTNESGILFYDPNGDGTECLAARRRIP